MVAIGDTSCCKDDTPCRFFQPAPAGNRTVGNEAFLAKWRGQVALPAGKWQQPYLTTVNRAALGRSVSVAAAGVIAGKVPRW